MELLFFLACQSGDCPADSAAECGTSDSSTSAESDADTDADGDSDSDTDTGGDTAPVTPTWYHDADSDTYGDPASPFEADTAPAGYVANADDCNDADAAISPGATEMWGDGVDNDCDGVIDDPEAVEGHYTGTVSMSIHLEGSSTCSWYGGTYLTCDGTAEATAYASSNGAIFSGSFSCSATGGGSSCGDGTTFAGDLLMESTGGTSFSGDVRITNGGCSSYSYDGTASTTASVSGTAFSTSFELYSCLTDLSHVTATIELTKAP